MDCSLSRSSVHGILQPRILEWVAISFSGDLPDPGIEPRSPTLHADSLPAEPQGKVYKSISLKTCQLLFPLIRADELKVSSRFWMRLKGLISHNPSPSRPVM